MAAATSHVRILLVTQDPSVEAEVHETCRMSEVLQLVGTVARADEAASLARQRHVQAILLDGSVLDDLENTIFQISLAAPECYVFTLLPLADIDAAQRSLLAGARGFITKPIDPERFEQTIVRVLTLEALRQGEGEGHRQKGRVITLLAAKSGTGRTILATNLAVALHKQSDKRVLVMEATTLPGDLAAAFSIMPRYTLMDILVPGRDIEPMVVEQIISEHNSGVFVLPSATDYESKDIEAGRVRSLLRLVRQDFDYIIIDTGELQDPLTEMVVTETDTLLLITSPDLLALHRTVKFYAALMKDKETSTENVVLVLNKAGMPGGIRRSVLHQLLNERLEHTIAYDSTAVMESIWRGVPLVVLNERSAVAKDIERLASVLLKAEKGPGERTPNEQTILTRLRALLASPMHVHNKLALE